jgi:chaperonin cofactor prefoldin
VRDLEAKLNALENNTHSLQSDNDRLKMALQRAHRK